MNARKVHARWARAAVVVAALAVAAGASGCGNAKASSAGQSAKRVKQLPASTLPSSVLGLTVTREDMSKALSDAQRTYIDATGLYGLRQGELLEATLQVNRLGTDPRFQSAKFRRTIVAQIGNTIPQPLRVGDATVYQSTGRSQRISVWFRGRYFLVLAVREDYTTPRTLLRKALEISKDLGR